MNDTAIDEAAERFVSHPALGPATRTLANLRTCADSCSDGWAYWPKPCRAAAQLQELIQGDGSYDARYGPRNDVTAADVKKAYRPIRAFLTRNGLAGKCEIVEPV